MSDDDDWEFTALEEDKRTVPELVIELGCKSYADVVLQRQPTKFDVVSITKMPHEIQCSSADKLPAFLKLKPNRKQELRRQTKHTQKEETLVTCILKRKVPLDETLNVNRESWNSMAENFALSEDSSKMMERYRSSMKSRMPYTKILDNWS